MSGSHAASAAALREQQQQQMSSSSSSSPPPQPTVHRDATTTSVPSAPLSADVTGEPPAPPTPREQATSSRSRAGSGGAVDATLARVPRLVTWVTHDAPGLAKLRESAAASGAALDVVFTPTRFGPRHGWGPRLLAMHAYVCDASRCPDESEILIAVDGFDVLVKRDLRFAAAEFEAMVAGLSQQRQPAATSAGVASGGGGRNSFCVLLSAETACSPDGSIAHRFPPTSTPYPFPNAGAGKPARRWA
jgi:hypothetical protein